MAKLLRKKLVAEKVCKVDRTGQKYIDSPYGSQPSTTVQTIAGTYSTATFTLTDDGLTVTDEFIVAEHIYDFEETLTKFDVFKSRINELNSSAATALDKWVNQFTAHYKFSLITGKVQEWITRGKQALAVQPQRLSERTMQFA